MKEPLRNALSHWLLTWLTCVALAAGLGELLRLDCRWWLAAPVLLLWCAALAAAEHFGRAWAMLALWAVALGLCLLLSDRESLLEAALAAVSRTGTAGGYGEMLLLMLCATAALPLRILLELYWARAVLSLSWMALWIAAALLEWPVPRIVPTALIPLLLLTLSETIHRSRCDPEPNESQKRTLLLSLLPAVLLLALLPAPTEPYGYPLLHSIAERVEELWYDAETALRYRRGGEQQFGVSFNGFTDEAELGHDPDEDSLRIVYANPQLAPDGALYLFGNALDRFDGRGWSSSLEPWAAERLRWGLDTAEHVYALWRLLQRSGMESVFSDFFRANSVYLSYRNMNARTMFNVMNATQIYTDEERFPYADTPTGSLFQYVQQDETWYRVYYLEPNARTTGALIAASEGAAYDAEERGPRWYRVARDLGCGLDLGSDVYLEETLAARADLIRAVYLDTEGVSTRARALAEEITAGCDGDYAKLTAIAAYLQENYSYTLRPGAVPEGADFLDWLLFEGREGYCTWYATAAVLLARSVGVPARYVQGYRGELAEAVFTPLGQESAHAWCEGYVAGYGWVTVEATPGFGGGAGWLTAAEARELRADEPATAPVPHDDPLGSDVDESDKELPVPGGHGGKADESVPEHGSEPARRSVLPVLIPAVVLAALPTVWLGMRARRKRRYAQADGATRLRLDLERLLRDLRGMGYTRRPEESLRQFFARLPWRYLPASEEAAKEAVALYERIFFASAQPSAAELEKHRAFADCFRPMTLRQRIRYWTGS